MTYISFFFENSNQDQSFSYEDEKDPTGNPHHIGPVNSGDESGPHQCWAGSDGEGSIVLIGTGSGRLRQEISSDNYRFRY